MFFFCACARKQYGVPIDLRNVRSFLKLFLWFYYGVIYFRNSTNNWHYMCGCMERIRNVNVNGLIVNHIVLKRRYISFERDSSGHLLLSRDLSQTATCIGFVGRLCNRFVT